MQLLIPWKFFVQIPFQKLLLIDHLEPPIPNLQDDFCVPFFILNFLIYTNRLFLDRGRRFFRLAFLKDKDYLFARKIRRIL